MSTMTFSCVTVNDPHSEAPTWILEAQNMTDTYAEYSTVVHLTHLKDRIFDNKILLSNLPPSSTLPLMPKFSAGFVRD